MLMTTIFKGAVNRNWMFFYLYFIHHYMFRPLQAILRWNILVISQGLVVLIASGNDQCIFHLRMAYRDQNM
jgi:hypothetical protein